MTLSTVAATGASEYVVSSWKLESSSTNTSGQRTARWQRVEHGFANVAGDDGREPGGPGERAGQRSHRRLAVRARDRDHLRVRRQRAREELDVADELRAARNRRRDERLILGNAGADRDQVGTRDGRRAERAGQHANIGELRAEPVRERWRGPRVRDPDGRPARCEMPCERVPGEPKAEHDSVAIRVGHQRSFSDESPNSTSSIVMIQNRTTTWFSFQPFSS